MPIIDVAGVGEVEFPDSMSQEQIKAVLDKKFGKPQQAVRQSEAANAAAMPQARDLMGSMEEAEARKLVGAGRGLTDVAEGLKQLYLQATGGDAEGYTRKAEAERAVYEQTPAGQSMAGRAGRIAGATAPAMLIPGAQAGAALPVRMATGAGAGAAIGGASFVPEGESRLVATGKGALAGATVPAALEALKYPAAKAVNAVRGVFKSPQAETVIKQGERFDVPVFAPDVAGPGTQKTAQYLEDVPVVGMRGERVAQMQKAQQAAETLRGKYVQGGDDIGRIIQAGMKNKEYVVRAVKAGKYEKISAIADDLGIVPTDKMQVTAKDIINRELSKPQGYQDSALIKEIQRYTESPNGKFSDLQRLRSEVGERIRALQTNKMPMASASELDALKQIKSGLEKDMGAFATSSGDDLARLWKNADKYYRMKFLPFKEPEIQRAIKNDEPDRIFDYFIKGGYGDRAKKFYSALDNSGRQSVRYGIVDKAYKRAYDDASGVFSPAKFATEIEKLDDAAKVFFKGTDYSEVKGFANLMRHVQRAGQVGPGPATGVQTVPILGAMGVGGLSVIEPVAGAAAIGSTVVLKKLFTTKAGRNLLLASSVLKPGTPAMNAMSQKVEDLLVRATATGSTRVPGPQL